ncbi:MAG: CRISPR-associated endonuclease Cas1 [Chloroflexota bacterium]
MRYIWSTRRSARQSRDRPTRLRQYESVKDSHWALDTACAIVSVKLHHSRTLLRRYARRTKPQTAAASLTEAADQLGLLIDRGPRCQTVNSLHGVEGRGAAVYFSVFRHLIHASG